MGTIIDKLNWLRIKKNELVEKINTKFTRANMPQNNLGTNPSLDRIDSALEGLDRRRLVPVMTMYMVYTYGSVGGVGKYVPLKHYTSSYNWLDGIVSKVRCMYDIETPWETLGKAPILNREAEGVIVGSMPTHKYNAVYNQPFVIGMGIEDLLSVQSRWETKAAFASLSYAYTNGNIKILLADDSTKNDGTFILGNIALVDPLAYPEVRDDFMVQLVNTHFNSPTRSNNVYGNFGNYTFQNTGVNITTISVHHGYNDYSYIWPVVVGELHPSNPQPCIMASIKKITITQNRTQIVVATGRNGEEHREGFKLFVYAKK